MKSIPEMARLVRRTAGRFFYAEDVTKSGKLRKLWGRTQVRRNITGYGLPYKREDYDLMVVWDVKRKGYRMLNLRTLLVLRCGEIRFDRRQQWLAILERSNNA